MGSSPFNVGYTPQSSLSGLTLTPAPTPMTGNSAPNNGSSPSSDDGSSSLDTLQSYASDINLPTNGGTNTAADITNAASKAVSGDYIGAAVSLVTSLLQGHAVRAKDAANENTQMNQIIPYVTQAFLQLVAGMKAGKYTAAQATQMANNIVQSYNSFVTSLQGKPGVADDGGTTCGKTCTAGCCLRTNYVMYLYKAVIGAINGIPPQQPVINPNGKQWILGTTGIPANKYGFAGVPAYKVPIVFVPGSGIPGVGAVEAEFTKFITWIRGIL